MDKREYLILDFGKVIAGPTMENWFITPNFWNIIDKNKVSLEKFKEAIKHNGYLLDKTMCTEAEEAMIFSNLYTNILKELGIEVDDDIIESLSDDWTFNDNKFTFYPNIKKELELLNQKYRLLLLTDNWPSVLRIMHNNDTYKYFEKIYVSSMYGCKKSEKVFFDYPIMEFNLQGKRTIFVDDDLVNLEMAEQKGLEPVLMDRDNETGKVKYKKINNLYNL